MTNDERFQNIVSTILSEHPDVDRSQMFGVPSLRVQGYFFAGLRKETMIFKLTGEEHQAALAVPGAKPFSPMGSTHMMKEWVEIPAQSADVWLRFTRAALEYARTLPPKPANGKSVKGKGKK